jgi:hypothetical protein
MSTLSRIVLACLAAVVVSGCGGEASRNLPKAPVTGTVSYTKPFPQGEITFQHPSGEMAVAKFGEDGKYQVDVPVGPNKVMVRSQTSNLEQGKRPGGVELFTNHLPAKYSSFTTSKLEYTVKDGQNEFNVPLAD